LDRIPIIILGKTKSGKIAELFLANPDFEVLRCIIPGEIKTIGIDKQNKPDLLVIVDIDRLPIQPNVTTSLLLRNAGFQVFLSCDKDYSELIEVIKEIHKFIKDQIEKNEKYRPEVILTHETRKRMGNIQSFIDGFEEDVKILKTKLN
jgi:hypothetical protein